MSEEQDGLTVFRLPRSHRHATLSNFEWVEVQPASLRQRVDAFLMAVAGGEAPHLVLTGTPGIGKTHLGVAIYRRATVVHGTELVTWLDVSSFCERVKQSYGGGADPWEDVQAAKRLVVLDDLFGRTLTAHEKDQVITRLLDMAYQNGAAVVATMNPSHEQLPALLPAHEVSRLLAQATIIPMKASRDRRRG